ncbi:MAG: primosomal protein N' [Clostridiales bacterium]|jgi:primosomal protein N' (replication factor Y)|nr:primosomal protein N' [Clostridiales bacterium]
MVAQVIIDISNDGVDRVFDYNVPDGVVLGSRVAVPFLNRRVQGYVIGVKESSDYAGALKDVSEVLDEGLIGGEMLALMDFMTAKYNLRRIDVLRLFLPPNMREGGVRELKRRFVSLNPDFGIAEFAASVKKSAQKQLELIKILQDGGDYLTNLNALYGGTVNTLIKKGALIVSDRRVRRTPNSAYGKTGGRAVELTADQKKCVDEIVKSGRFLLHGVTGSGKTEVYMRVIEHAVKNGRTAVMLVPEISLTAQFYKLFKERFFDDVAIIHSGLSAGERFDEWSRILNGEARVVIGARSAIFAPLKDLGVIIIDEEHDGSYASESNPRYNAKDVAAFRAEYNGAALVLGSATPSVDTYFSMKNGEYKLLSMPNRVNDKRLPKIEIVDMCRELREGNAGLFSRRLEDAVARALKEGNQAMIYLNRRGYSSFVMCRACGYVAKCSDCDISLTYHIDDGVLKCHYCGKKFHMISECPECGGKNLRFGKTGTEKVVKEMGALFPKARILRMDNDTTREKDGHEKILGAFYKKEADILVGTQMIAKGHDFSDVTLVGILDADMSLYFSDYRSSERTFQLMTQVAGRAGREKKSGEVVLQTYAPRHYVFRLAERYDYGAFYEKEINSREVTKYPPFTVIVRVLVTADEDAAAMKAVRKIYNGIKEFAEKTRTETGRWDNGGGAFVYIGAMRSPVSKIQNKYRYQILMRVKNDGNAERIINGVYGIADAGQGKGLTVFTEINPQSLV